MRTFRIGAAFSAIALLALAPAQAASSARLDEVMSYDGLRKIQVKGIEVAYARPGTSLASYDKVRLGPVEVAFDKDWNPNRTGSRFKLSEQDRDTIRSGLAKIVQDEFAKALQAQGGYRLATQAGPGVLDVQVNLIDVYVSAPDAGSSGRGRTYAISAGRMTLVATLTDSGSGEVLARVIDRREARLAGGQIRLTNSVVNASEAGAAASRWARILRRELDLARAAATG